MEYYLVLIRKEILTHATTKMKPVMLTEISQSQMEEHCTIPLIGEESNSETKSKTVVTKGLEKRRMGNYCLMGRIQFGKMEMFWRWIVVTVTHQCECSKW